MAEDDYYSGMGMQSRAWADWARDEPKPEAVAVPIAPVVEVPQDMNGKTPTAIAMGSAQGITTSEMAQMLDVPRGTIFSWGKRWGKTAPTHKGRSIPLYVLKDDKWYPVEETTNAND
jgi:hypothetical protein